MIGPTPSSKVSNGLIRGFKCPIDGTQFVSESPSSAQDQAHYFQQQEHTYALMVELDRRYGDKKTVADYIAVLPQYALDLAAEQQQ